MYNALFSSAILKSVALFQIYLLVQNTKANSNDVDVSFRWSEYQGDVPKQSNLSLESYNDYVELDYESKERLPNATNEFEQKLLDAEIVDDVMESFPEECLKVTFKHGDLIPGQRFSLLEAWDQPTVTYDTEPRQFHTLLLNCNSKYIPFSSESQPEITLPETGSESAKWLVVNIPGNNISAGRTLIDYTPPIRRHFKQVVDRYIFMLYKQRLKIRDHWLPDPVHGDTYRSGEILNDSYSFAEYYRLGNPIAVNFFIMHW